MGIEIIHIGLVVLGVMDLQLGFRDDGLESIVAIVQGRELIFLEAREGELEEVPDHLLF